MAIKNKLKNSLHKLIQPIEMKYLVQQHQQLKKRFIKMMWMVARIKKGKRECSVKIKRTIKNSCNKNLHQLHLKIKKRLL